MVCHARRAQFRGAFLLLFSIVMSSPAHTQISADFGGVNGGAVRVGQSSTPCTAGSAGALRWSSIDLTVEMCDGGQWRKIIASADAGAPSIPNASDGYFVLSAGAWNGDLKTAGTGTDGYDGANKLCLDDLTNNDWMGKGDAQTRGLLAASKVKAFLCASNPSSCQNVLPSVRYFFAVSGDSAKGGASFTANANAEGPGNTQNWSGVNYFDGDKTYWTGRSLDSTDLLWPKSSWVEDQRSCTKWTSAAVTTVTLRGISNATDKKRWVDTGIGGNCASSQKLICLVHP